MCNCACTPSRYDTGTGVVRSQKYSWYFTLGCEDLTPCLMQCWNCLSWTGPEPRGRRGVTADSGGRPVKRTENYGQNWSLLSLSQGSNAHISSCSRALLSPDIPTLTPFSVPPPECRKDPTFQNRSPFSPFVQWVLYFVFLLSFLSSALTSNHLTKNEWMNVWRVTVCNVDIGKCIFTTCEHGFSFFLHSLSWINWLCFSFTRLQKPQKREKNLL